MEITYIEEVSQVLGDGMMILGSEEKDEVLLDRAEYVNNCFLMDKIILLVRQK